MITASVTLAIKIYGPDEVVKFLSSCMISICRHSGLPGFSVAFPFGEEVSVVLNTDNNGEEITQ
jgi:hypothetical protein